MRRAALLALAAACSALPTFASGGEGGWFAPLWGLPTIVWQFLNFFLVVALFAFLLRSKLPAFFSGRADAIRKDLEKALRDKETALARLREVESKMSRLQDEVDAIQRESAAAAEAEKVRLLAEAEASRDRLRAEAKGEMDRQVSAARKELRSYAASLVARLAREEIVRDLTGRDEEFLMEDFLRKMESEDHDRAG